MKNKIKYKTPKLSKQQCYITLKDYNLDFQNKLSCKIINPAKTFIGKPDKTNLDKINNLIKLKNNLRQWINTNEALNWFNNLDIKST